MEKAMAFLAGCIGKITNGDTLRRYIRPVKVRPEVITTVPAAHEAVLFRTLPIKHRSQTFNPRNGKWVKRNNATGLFCSVKRDGSPFYRIVKEKRRASPSFLPMRQVKFSIPDAVHVVRSIRDFCFQIFCYGGINVTYLQSRPEVSG